MTRLDIVYTVMHNGRNVAGWNTMEATKVGIREFRSGLADFIASETTVAITRHGQTVGYFIPAHGQAEADIAALRRASAELDRLLGAHAVDQRQSPLSSK